MKRNPDDEFTKLLRLAKTGDRIAVLKLVDYWKRQGAGPFEKSERLTYDINLKTDPSVEELFVTYTTRPIIWNIWRNGNLTLIIRNDNELRCSGILATKTEYEVRVDSPIVLIEDKWVAGEIRGDEYSPTYRAWDSDGNDYESRDFIVPLINIWAKNHPQILNTANKLDLNREIQGFNFKIESIQKELQNYQDQLIVVIKEYLVKSDEPIKNPEEEPSLTQAWKSWVMSPNGKTERRKLIVQIINALKCAYTWQSYDKAIENMKYMGVGPTEAPESLTQALQMAKKHNWEASKIRNDLR